MVFCPEFVEDLIHSEKLIQGFVQEKFKFRNFPELFSDFVGERKAEAMDVFIHGGHHFQFIFGVEDRKVDFGALQVGGDDHAGHGDHGFVKNIGSLIHEDHTELPAQEFIDLLLSLCFHGGNTIGIKSKV